jgi:hypothetical protein
MGMTALIIARRFWRGPLLDSRNGRATGGCAGHRRTWLARRQAAPPQS